MKPIIMHLPGDGPNDEWFQRMNWFEQQETRRQAKFKMKQKGWIYDLAPGDVERVYPHIIYDAKDDASDVLNPKYAGDIREYLDNNGIARHKDFHNLRSSQVCCLNVMFPLKGSPTLAVDALRLMLPDVAQVTRIEFEYTGNDELGHDNNYQATDYLGEDRNGKRGQNRTSIDVAIWWTNTAGKSILTLGEWKYTEKEFGNCGGYVSNGNGMKGFCEGMGITSPGTLDYGCYLHHHRDRKYWNLLSSAGLDISKWASLSGCSFKGPFYQLMRQFLLASCLREKGAAEEVEVVVFSFDGNERLMKTPSELTAYGQTVIEAWNHMVVSGPKLRRVSVDLLGKAISADMSGKLDNHAQYIHERYGL